MADIQATSPSIESATNLALSSGRTANLENAESERVQAEDSGAERAQAERSETGPGVGSRVDISV